MSLAVRLARREMRSGLGGFRLFIACLALGVAAIAGILSFSRAVEEGLRADAREILGGDVAISLLYREATPEQVDFLKTQGQLVRWIDSRAMARPTKSDGRPTLVQLKAVEPAYPLYGTVELKGGGSLADALARRDGVWGAVVEDSALKRMNLAPGDRVRVGDVTVEVQGHHRPRARPRAERLRKPRPAPHDPLRGRDRIGPHPARQPAQLGVPAAPAAGPLRRRRHQRAQEPFSRCRLAGEGARRGGRRHPLLARPADPVHRPDRPRLPAGGRRRRRQRDLELPGRPAAHHRHHEVPGRAGTAGHVDLSHPALGPCPAGRR